MSWQKGLGGAASGAAAGSVFGPWGAGIGGAIGGLAGLFGGGGDDAAQQQLQAQQDMYKDLLAHYQGPESNPQYQQMMSGLAQSAQGGLTPQDRAAMLEAYSNSSQMAKGREGALEQQAMMRGGGVANSGQLLGAQQQASQNAAQNYQSAGTQQAGIASGRALQAKMGYLQQLQNNAQSMNNYRLQAAGGLSGSYQNMANMYGAQGESNNMALQNGLGTAANMAMYKYGVDNQKPQMQNTNNFAPQQYGYAQGVGRYGSPQGANFAYALPGKDNQNPYQQKTDAYGSNGGY